MGIGEAFAEALAARGYDLALVARSAAALDEISARLRERYAIQTMALVADLQASDAVERVVAAVEARFGRVDLLVNNAGFGAHAPFATIDGARSIGQLRLNIEALVALTGRCATAMLERGTGGIINVASTAAFAPVPYMAVYGATKAFVLSFSEALAVEFRERGVRVLAVCPGPTSTNFFKTAGEGFRFGRFRTSEQVVRSALRAYDRGADVIVDGRLNAIVAALPRLFPRSTVARMAGRVMRHTRR